MEFLLWLTWHSIHHSLYKKKLGPPKKSSRTKPLGVNYQPSLPLAPSITPKSHGTWKWFSFQVRYISFSTNFQAEPCSPSRVYYARRFHQKKIQGTFHCGFFCRTNACTRIIVFLVRFLFALRITNLAPQGFSVQREHNEVIENPSYANWKKQKLNKIKHLNTSCMIFLHVILWWAYKKYKILCRLKPHMV